jgi:hypothetical protein
LCHYKNELTKGWEREREIERGREREIEREREWDSLYV